jgi:hypothetical protein
MVLHPVISELCGQDQFEFELGVHVDVRFPNRSREEPYLSWLRKVALEGLKSDRRWDVRVWVGHQQFLVLTHREVELTPGGGVLKVDEDRFEFIPTKSEADLLQEIERAYDVLHH